jgi:hypothetical protein
MLKKLLRIKYETWNVKNYRIWIRIMDKILNETYISVDIGILDSNSMCTYSQITRLRRSILHFSPEDGGSMFLRNVGIYLQVHMAYYCLWLRTADLVHLYP